MTTNSNKMVLEVKKPTQQEVELKMQEGGHHSVAL